MLCWVLVSFYSYIKSRMRDIVSCLFAYFFLRWEFIKENKKVRKQEKKGKQELGQESDQEKRKFFLFFLVEFLFSYFLVFFYKFPPLLVNSCCV